MASDKSALSRTFTGSFLEAYQQYDNTVRLRVYLTPNAADYEIIITAAHWATLIANVIGTGGTPGNYTRTAEAWGPMGADKTVNA